MLGQAVRAIYEHGQLRLLDPVDLTEGQEIGLMILSERERAKLALADMLIQYDPGDPDLSTDLDEDALQKEIDASIAGNPDVSGAIIEERREGP